MLNLFEEKRKNPYKHRRMCEEILGSKTKIFYLYSRAFNPRRNNIPRDQTRFRRRGHDSAVSFSNSCENDKVQQLNSWWKHTNCNPTLNDTNVASVLRIRCAQPRKSYNFNLLRRAYVNHLFTISHMYTHTHTQNTHT